MSEITPLMPRQPVPELEVDLARGGRWCLADRHPQNFTLVVFYRGLHCPICSRQLRDLEDLLPDFDKRGVDVVAISTDDRERGERTPSDWKLDRLPIGYGLGLDVARRWGLYVSSGRGKTSAGLEEPALFSEPGMFLVRPDNTLYFASVQSMPFARPKTQDLLTAIDFVLAKDYPARGEVVSIDQALAAE
ncbi:peroxiredoxin-like family protein [Microbaculum marinum]|uniref:Peroxiredoxin-like family protein n=1 Tax=Microbaculum marinum TaxID=1764581 RepID=A0AAW9RYV0_9HYPH